MSEIFSLGHKTQKPEQFLHLIHVDDEICYSMIDRGEGWGKKVQIRSKAMGGNEATAFYDASGELFQILKKERPTQMGRIGTVEEIHINPLEWNGSPNQYSMGKEFFHLVVPKAETPEYLEFGMTEENPKGPLVVAHSINILRTEVSDEIYRALQGVQQGLRRDDERFGHWHQRFFQRQS